MYPSSMSVKDLKEKLEEGELDLSLSTLTENDLPLEQMKQLKKFHTLDLSCNVMTSLPEKLCTFTQLTKLDISKNLLKSLPNNIGLLVNLKSLDLLGNRLTTLPESFGDLTSLRWLDVRNNPLSAAILKEAGDCLDDKQCKTCAIRVVKLMNYVHTEREKIRSEKRAQQEAEAQRLAEQEKEERKRQKQAEKERKRQEYLAQRQAAQENREKAHNSGDAPGVEKERTKELSSTTKASKSDSTSHVIMSAISTLFMSVVIVTAVLIGLYYYCETPKGQVQLQSVCKSAVGLTLKDYIEHHVIPVIKLAQSKMQALKS